jgi:hypothetical protein
MIPIKPERLLELRPERGEAGGWGLTLVGLTCIALPAPMYGSDR